MPVLPVDKPLGLTSHDVVARARRILGTRRVGHAGTLDPLATGVLTLLSDDATKLSPYLTGSDKTYIAWLAFGASTPTLDAEGPVHDVGDASILDEGAVRLAAASFLAVTDQRPPAFSAVKQGGVRSYRAARRGAVEEPPARPVAYRSVELLAFGQNREALPTTFAPDGAGHWGPAGEGRTFALPPTLGAYPTALIRLRVAAGTYVRSFARDVGLRLGVPAHLSALVRTAAGSIDLTRTISLETLGDASGIDPVEALALPVVRLDEQGSAAVRQGKRLPLALSGRSALVDPAGRLAAIAEPSGAEDPRAAAEGRQAIRLLRVWNQDASP
ncbi:MAG: tRNA pseudouridine(55) synthase TruB [Trueperaceae bacterium]